MPCLEFALHSNMSRAGPECQIDTWASRRSILVEQLSKELQKSKDVYPEKLGEEKTSTACPANADMKRLS